jgi:RimJ/RimL family protein N-acetyltransferase
LARRIPGKCAGAQRTYEAGFKAEGVARGSAFFGGVHRDELIMSVLKPEWIPVCQDVYP